MAHSSLSHDTAKDGGTQNPEDQFLRWIKSASQDERLRTMLQCFQPEGYGWLDIDRVAASRILVSLLGNQVDPKDYCTTVFRGQNYYLDTAYVRRDTHERIASLQDVSGLNDREYAYHLMELTEFGLLEMHWLESKHSKTRALSANIQALAEVWQDTTDAGGSTFELDGYVYVLGAQGFYKIGRAKNVDNRMKQLAIQLPWQVELIRTIPCEGYVGAEKYLHDRFSDARSNGEWFALSDSDLQWLGWISRMRGSRVEIVEAGS